MRTGHVTHTSRDGRAHRLDIAEARESEDDQNREYCSDPTDGRDIERRIKDQALDSVCAEVLYPNTSVHLSRRRTPGFSWPRHAPTTTAQELK